MHYSIRLLAVSGRLFLGSCGTTTATSQLIDTSSSATTVPNSEPADPSSTLDPVLPSLATSSTVGIPERIAFSASECAGFAEFGDAKTLQEIVPALAQDGIGPIADHFAASIAIGQAAKEQFESSVQAADSGEPPPVDDPEATASRIEALVQASTSPALIPSSAQLAKLIEEACGETNLGLALWNVNKGALFMQALPPAGYCEALAGSGLGVAEDVTALAPEAHREWITTLQTGDLKDESTRRVVYASSLKADMYRSAQCGEDLATLLKASE